ncbi:MAG TPA: hypothetical protein VH333_06930 [Pseudonocardiaceae bacterium]|nr:hypothetical protein [Pseudonocardiaceae bacterium]
MPSIHTRHPTRPRARRGGVLFDGPPPPLRGRVRGRAARARLAGWPIVLFWPQAWLTLCTIVEMVLLITLVAVIVEPGRTDAVLAETIWGLVLVSVILVQAVLYYSARRRATLGWPHGHRTSVSNSDPLGADVLARIADLDVAMAIGLDTAAAAVALPDDDLVMARGIATRATGALRELRAQTVALDRAAASTASPDAERLVAARQTIKLRLTRGLRDCAEFASVAGTPGTDDFRRRFAEAAERVSILVADINP